MIGRPPVDAGIPPAGVSGSRCGVSVGFFTLRPCGQLAAAVCSSCGRGACGRHLSALAPWLAGSSQSHRMPGSAAGPGPAGMPAQGQICVECAARHRAARDDGLDDLADDASFYIYRQGFYRRTYGSDAPGAGWFENPADRGALDAANLGDGDLDPQADDAAGLLDS
jgi:hypothetical protein